MRQQIKSWLLSNKRSLLIVCFLLLVSSFFHFYLLNSHLHFLSDEASHAQIIKDIIYKGVFPGRGPDASIDPRLYHGPFYYYLMLIPGLIGNYLPVSFAVFTVLLSIASVVLLYLTINEVYGIKVALATALVYSFSEAVIHFSRWAWNPNVIPFFVVLGMFSLVKILQRQKTEIFLPLFAFSVSAASQLHLTSYIFIVVFILFVPIFLPLIKDWKVWLFALVAFLIPWVPSLKYESSHNFAMFRALLDLISNPSNSSFAGKISSGYQHLLGIQNSVVSVGSLVSFFVGISILIYFTIRKFKSLEGKFSLYILIVVTLSIYMFGSFPGVFELHYGIHLFPIIPLFSGLMIGLLLGRKETILAVVIILYLYIRTNLIAFKADIVDGEKIHTAEQKICQIAGRNSHEVNLVVNGIENPAEVMYVCENENGLTVGSGKTLYFTADLSGGEANLIGTNQN